MRNEFAGSPARRETRHGASHAPSQPTTSVSWYRDWSGTEVAATPSGTTYRTRPCASLEIDSTSRTTGRSPFASRTSNRSPWSTNTEHDAPRHATHTNEIAAAVDTALPRSSTVSTRRDRQNSFHRSSSDRPSASPQNTTHEHDPTLPSLTSSTDEIDASGFNSCSRGTHTSARGRPTSSALKKKLHPTSAIATGVGSYTTSCDTPCSRQFLHTSTPTPRSPTTINRIRPKNLVVSAPSAAFCRENLFAARFASRDSIAPHRSRTR
mmetsp:Transcript_8478/g.26442  ORF Transcript_8478/g.26442 Transcript_8478/m.26442 type:complete len:266 (+) Transcript_8478:884-1681(+)